MNDFTNKDNTNLIWQLINEFVQTNHKVKISEENIPGLGQFFVNTINEINSKRFEYNNNIMVLNKEVLSRTAIYINQNIKVNQMQQNQMFNNNSIKLEYERKKDMTDGINKSLQSHKENFQSYQVKQPTNIDFSDKSQEFETNRNFNDTLAEREAELNRITSQYNANDAKKWIESANTDHVKEEANKKKVSFKIREITDKDNTMNPLDNAANPLDNDANAKENKLIDSILKNKTNDSPNAPGEKTYINPANFFNKLKIKKDEDDKNDVSDLTSQVNSLKSLVETLKNNQSIIMERLDKMSLLLDKDKDKDKQGENETTAFA